MFCFGMSVLMLGIADSRSHIFLGGKTFFFPFLFVCLFVLWDGFFKAK